jgi:hypothetical protein
MIRATLAAALVFAVAVPFAHADVYTWTDAKGVLNVSNLTPPDGVEVEKTVHETARASVPPPAPFPPPPPMIDPAAQAEVQFLAQRVRQLEYEVEFARRSPPPPMDYAAYSPPPPMQYMVDTAPPPANYGCDPSWYGCSGWGLGGYPVGIVVLNSPNFRRPQPGRGFHRSPMQLPVRGRGDPHRR